jgi:hypothetical protein
MWLSMRRLHVDRRARKRVFQFGLFLLVPVACLTYVAWLAGTGAWFLVPFVLPVLWWRNKKAKQEDISLRITPGPEPRLRSLSEGERQELRMYFADLTIYYAVMLSRAGSERFLKRNEVPEGREVIVRRTHRELLQVRGLWDRIARGPGCTDCC